MPDVRLTVPPLCHCSWAMLLETSSVSLSLKSPSAFMFIFCITTLRPAGPLLFKSTDAPLYRNGLKAVLGIFIAAGGATW